MGNGLGYLSREIVFAGFLEMDCLLNVEEGLLGCLFLLVELGEALCSGGRRNAAGDGSKGRYRRIHSGGHLSRDRGVFLVVPPEQAASFLLASLVARDAEALGARFASLALFQLLAEGLLDLLGVDREGHGRRSINCDGMMETCCWQSILNALAPW